jgi:D-aminopeptidase
MTSKRLRIREVGLSVGEYPPGKNNAITDVDSIKVGHSTIITGKGPLRVGVGPVRTGVTAIIPHPGCLIDDPVEASYFVFNGAGTTAGLSLIDEFGLIETPIMLTNTLSVGTVYDAVVRYMIRKNFRDREVSWFNPVVGETADGYLNDIGGLHVKAEHVFDALDSATGGHVSEGNVGAGTGTGALGFKGGIGTSSRRIRLGDTNFVVGVLVQSNQGGSLTIEGVPVGKELRKEEIKREEDGSIMVIIATNVPLSNRQLTRIAKRGTLGLTRGGWTAGHGSGDYLIAFSTSFRRKEWDSDIKAAREMILKNEKSLTPLFRATAEATEEAVLNSLFKATTMEGRDGHVRKGLPIEQVLQILKKFRRL